MYTITHVYAKQGHAMRVYTPEEKTLQEIKELFGIHNTVYIAVKYVEDDTGTTDLYGLNLSRMLADTKLFACGTWSELGVAITDKLVYGYETLIPGYHPGRSLPNNTVAVCDPVSYGGFNVEYLDMNMSDYRNAYHLRWKMPDLVISQTADKGIQLKNCLATVNGVTNRPVWQNGELFIPGGSKLAWNTDRTHTPEITLVDTTQLGGYEVLKFDEVTINYLNRNNTYNAHCDWEIVLPEQYSMYKYTPIVILGGSIIFPDELPKKGARSFTISPETTGWRNTLAYQKTRHGQDTNRTGIIYTAEMSPEEYLKNIRTGNYPDACIILLRAFRVYVNRYPFDTWINHTTLSVNTPLGVLYHEASGTIRNYHSTRMSNRQELMFQNLDVLSHLELPDTQAQLILDNPREQVYRLPSLQQGNCQMITISGE